MSTTTVVDENENKDPDSATADVTFHVVGDAYVDFFCFLDGDWPEYGGDSRLEHAVKCHAGGSSTNTATHLKSLIENFYGDNDNNNNTAATTTTDDDIHDYTAAANNINKKNKMMKKKPDVTLHTVLNPNDQYGHILLEHADKHQFPIHNCINSNDGNGNDGDENDDNDDDGGNVSTGHCIAIISGGERSFMTHQGVVGNFDADSIDVESIVGTSTGTDDNNNNNTDNSNDSGSDLHLHVAGFYNIPGFWNGKLKTKLESIRSVRQTLYPTKTTTISLVTQHDATKEWDGGLDELIPILDFVLMNDLEARSIIQRAGVNVDEFEHEHVCWATYFGSMSLTTNVIVTRGPKGAICLRGGTILGKQKPIVVKAIDPTGAGDSFTAGFIHGLWSWKFMAFGNEEDDNNNETDEKSLTVWPVAAIEEGMRWGVSVGSAAVMIRGASIPPDRKDIQGYLEQAKEPEHPVFK